MRPYVKPEQEQAEIDALRLYDCPFCSYIVSDGLIREMIRQSNPSLVKIAFRECREQYNAARQSWSPSLCRRMTLRIWKQLSSPNSQPTTARRESTVGADSSAPPRAVQRKGTDATFKERCLRIIAHLGKYFRPKS